MIIPGNRYPISNSKFRTWDIRTYLCYCTVSLIGCNLRKLSSWKISCCCNVICIIRCFSNFDEVPSFWSWNGDLIYFVVFVEVYSKWELGLSTGVDSRFRHQRIATTDIFHPNSTYKTMRRREGYP